MIRSKLFVLSKALARDAGTRQFSTTRAKLSGGEQLHYRVFPEASRPYQIWSEVCGAMMWWWILWNLFTDYQHLIGHFPYPEPDVWTDDELGIPPDSQED